MSTLRRLGFIAVVFVFLAANLPTGNVEGAAAHANGPMERVIVVFHSWVDQPAVVAEQMGRSHNARVSFTYEHAIKGFAAEIPSQAITALSRDSRVAFVEIDQEVQAFGDIPTGVDRIEADKNATASIDGIDQRVSVDIAILDTGIDHNHPDLNVVSGTDCARGGPFNQSCRDGFPGDGNGHGTHVAGTAAAFDNGSPAVGVAPGARLWPVKVLSDNGSGYMSWIVAGIDWVTARADQIEVANMSLGCECQSAALDQALTGSTDAGVVYVVAAGNSAADAKNYSPANHSQVITVSAIADYDGKAGGVASPTCRDYGPDDSFATFSNFGSVVNIAAPGVCILSTVPGGGYTAYSGTSMASPHAAGATALYIVEKGVTQREGRWQAVRDGLVGEWTVAQNNACGFTGGKSSEPFLLLASCDVASGGDAGGSITGTVADAVTESGISGATVTVEGTAFTVTTNADGSYSIVDVPEGNYSVTASASGYEPETKAVSVTANDSTSAQFSLTPVTSSAPSPLQVDVSTDRPAYAIGDNVQITVAVRQDEGDPVSGASVSMRITTASGRIYSEEAMTDVAGKAIFTFKIKRPDGSGEYRVDASASKSGYEAGSGSTTFQVQ